MSVRFRFTNDKEESTIACEGYHIKAFELKREIVKRRRFGRTTTFDLKVTDSSLGKSYENEDLIPRNSSLTIARHPLPKGAKPIEWEKEDLPSAATSAEVAARFGHNLDFFMLAFLHSRIGLKIVFFTQSRLASVVFLLSCLGHPSLQRPT